MAKSDASRHAPEEVDAYLSALPDDDRAALDRLRAIVKEVAPESTERVSYGIPIFRIGRDLVGMSAHTKHCSLHTLSPELVAAMGTELAGVEVSGATIHFSRENPLPRDLVVQIVRRRIDEMGGVD